MFTDISNIFNLSGKTAIVTGAQRGLGQAMAKGLNEFGANVVICDKTDDFDESLSMLGKNSMALRTDITNDAEVKQLVAKTAEKFGSIDILVNNAGIGYFQDTFNMDPEEFTKIFDVNVLGMFLCSRAVFPFMKEKGKGKIVNIASMYGARGMNQSDWIDDPDVRLESHSYNASKGAVINLTRELAGYWGKFGINVNSISPGMMLTDQAKKNFNKWLIAKLRQGGFEVSDSTLESDSVQKFEKRIPLKRVGKPSDLIGPVVFLSSDAAGYVNGVNLFVDGGWVCW